MEYPLIEQVLKNTFFNICMSIFFGMFISLDTYCINFLSSLKENIPAKDLVSPCTLGSPAGCRDDFVQWVHPHTITPSSSTPTSSRKSAFAKRQRKRVCFLFL